MRIYESPQHCRLVGCLFFEKTFQQQAASEQMRKERFTRNFWVSETDHLESVIPLCQERDKCGCQRSQVGSIQVVQKMLTHIIKLQILSATISPTIVVKRRLQSFDDDLHYFLSGLSLILKPHEP